MMAESKHYIRGDGNGGWQISNSIAILAIFITLILALVPTIYAYGQMSERVDQIETKAETNYNTLDNIDDKVTDTRERIIRIESDIEYIKKSLN